MFRIGCVLVTCILICGVLLKTFMDPGPGTWPDWLAAIGTIGAFAGTIWIASTETRRNNRQKIAIARIAAPALVMRLTKLLPTLKNTIENLKKNGTDVRYREFCAKQLKECPLWTLAELEPIICLQKNCAVNMSLVREIVQIGIITLTDQSQAGINALPGIIPQLELAYIHTESAIETLRNVHSYSLLDG